MWRRINLVGEFGSGEGTETISEVDRPEPGRPSGRIYSRLLRDEGTSIVLGSDAARGVGDREIAGDNDERGSVCVSTEGVVGTVAAVTSSGIVLTAIEGLDIEAGRGGGGISPSWLGGTVSPQTLGSEAYSAEVRDGGRGGRSILGASLKCSVYSEMDQLSGSPSASVLPTSTSTSVSLLSSWIISSRDHAKLSNAGFAFRCSHAKIESSFSAVRVVATPSLRRRWSCSRISTVGVSSRHSFGK